MSEEVTLRRGFTGLWIPADIVEDERLTMLEKWLYGEIEAFNRGNDKRGCFASNSFFAKQLGVKENTVSKAISHLKELGLIEQVAFDGRQRILKIIGSIGFKSQSALDKNHSLSNKEERKEENKERSVSFLEERELFKKEYPRPAYNKSTVSAFDDAWDKAMKLGEPAKDILAALFQKKKTTPDPTFWASPVSFILEHGKGADRKNPDYKSVVMPNQKNPEPERWGQYA